jgi:hypothetical protein
MVVYELTFILLVCVTGIGLWVVTDMLSRQINYHS